MIQTKQEIMEGLEKTFQDMMDFINTLDQTSFEENPQGKWSAGQQLDHLIKSTRPINLVLIVPKFVFPFVFGRMNRLPKNYEALLARYNEKLAQGGTASSPYIPLPVRFEERTKKVSQFKKQLDSLLPKLKALSNKQLDTLILPHPLLGKLSLREMMFFTIFHTEHHLKILKER